jgi:hypothetical protein
MGPVNRAMPVGCVDVIFQESNVVGFFQDVVPADL